MKIRYSYLQKISHLTIDQGNEIFIASNQSLMHFSFTETSIIFSILSFFWVHKFKLTNIKLSWARHWRSCTARFGVDMCVNVKVCRQKRDWNDRQFSVTLCMWRILMSLVFISAFTVLTMSHSCGCTYLLFPNIWLSKNVLKSR